MSDSLRWAAAQKREEEAAREGEKVAEVCPTRRVRIPLAMRANGKWAAYGHYLEEVIDMAILVEGLYEADAEPDDHHIVWIEADVPLPVHLTVEGEVKGD